jgi:CHASE3 domain sensor protein
MRVSKGDEMNPGSYSIQTKMIVLVVFVMLALVTIMGYIYTKLDRVQTLFDQTSEYSSRQDLLKRIDDVSEALYGALHQLEKKLGQFKV